MGRTGTAAELDTASVEEPGISAAPETFAAELDIFVGAPGTSAAAPDIAAVVLDTFVAELDIAAGALDIVAASPHSSVAVPRTSELDSSAAVDSGCVVEMSSKSQSTIHGTVRLPARSHMERRGDEPDHAPRSFSLKNPA